MRRSQDRRRTRGRRRALLVLLMAGLLGVTGCNPMAMLGPILSKISGMLGPAGKLIPQIAKLATSSPVAGGTSRASARSTRAAPTAAGTGNPDTDLNDGSGAARDQALNRSDASQTSADPAAAPSRPGPDAGEIVSAGARVAQAIPGVGDKLGPALGLIGSLARD